MAEAWLCALGGVQLVVGSAGTLPVALHPLTVQVMAEERVDIGHQRSKHVDERAGSRPTVVVNVCDIAREERVVWLRATNCIHWRIPDPAAVADGDEQRGAFRAVCDALRLRVRGLLALLAAGRLALM